MRVRSWLDRSGSNEAALITMIESASRFYSQLRGEQEVGAGMISSKGKPEFHQYIEMRIDPASANFDNLDYIGLSVNADIIEGDVIRVPRTDGSYDALTVTNVNRIGRVAQVELHYGN